ncbi:uncharacterized protein LOC131669875 [Phymastichus coffea]|uniref:uncharacterized protein LOC131669875 n=1 Tax=Phymastichus coffea TaxID=108790 RepID=UPI00273C48A8|nr:uncharacterized protein LOC131669875 [Phymastichus coffea]
MRNRESTDSDGSPAPKRPKCMITYSLIELFVNYILSPEPISPEEIQECIMYLTLESTDYVIATEIQSKVRKKLKYILPVILECNGNINYADIYGQTILHVFVMHYSDKSIFTKIERSKDQEIVETLIKKGASVNVLDLTENTPIHYAAINHRADLILLMLGRFTNVNAVNGSGYLVLHELVDDYIEDPDDRIVEAVRILVSKGADYRTVKNKMDIAPLDMAIKNGLINIIEAFQMRDADPRLLLEICKNADSWSHYPDEMQHLDRVLDLERGVNEYSDKFMTPLHYAAQYGRKNEVVLFVNAGANIEAATCDGVTALHLAVMRGQVEIARYLIERGANLRARDHVFDFGLLHLAALQSNRDVVGLLMDNGLSVHDGGRDGFTPLHVAAAIGNEWAMRCFIGHGADTRCRTNVRRSTVLHLVAAGCFENLEQLFSGEYSVVYETYLLGKATFQSRRDESINLILQIGANPNARDSLMKTPLHYAADNHERHPDAPRILLTLLRYGARVDVRGIDERSPIVSCQRVPDSCGMKELIRYGADIDDIDFFTRNDYLEKQRYNLLHHLKLMHAADLPMKPDHSRHYNHCLREMDRMLAVRRANPIYEQLFRNRNDFYNSITLEVAALKAHRLMNEDTTLYDFLHMNIKHRSYYVNYVLSLDLEIRYPIYQALIENFCRRAINRQTIVSLGIATLNRLLTFNLPVICSEKIFHFMTLPQITAFIDRMEDFLYSVHDITEKLYMKMSDRKHYKKGRTADRTLECPENNSVLFLFVHYVAVIDSHDHTIPEVSECVRILENKITDNLTPFQNFVISKLIYLIPIVLECNNDINFKDACGRTILHNFIIYSCDSRISSNEDHHVCEEKIVEALMKKGASVDVVDAIGNTPVHYAAINRRIDLVILMLDNFTNVNAFNAVGLPVLHTLLEIYREVPEDVIVDAVQILISKGAEFRVLRTLFRATPLNLAITHGMIKILEAFGINDRNYQNLLFRLCERSFAWVNVPWEIQELGNIVNLREEVTKEDPNTWWTPLHYVSESGQIEAVQLFLDAGANINAFNSDHMTPLHLAVLGGHVQLTEYLIDRGADWHARASHYHFSLLHLAILSGSPCMIAHCLKMGFPAIIETPHGVQPLHVAALLGDPRMIQILLQCRADVHCRIYPVRYTALHLILLQNQFRFFKALSNCPCDAFDAVFHRRFRTADLQRCMVVLLQAGANVNARDANRKTLLHHAVRIDENKNLARTAQRLLIEYGAWLDAHCSIGEIPIDLYFIKARMYPVTRFLDSHCDKTDVCIYDVMDALYKIRDHPFLRYYQLMVAMGFTFSKRHQIMINMSMNQPNRDLLKEQIEITKLKSVMLNKKITLYAFLHMNSRNRSRYANLVLKMNLKKEFPIYKSIIENRCRQSINSRMILKDTKPLFDQIIQYPLPDNCFELIFSFLNWDDVAFYISNKRLICVSVKKRSISIHLDQTSFKYFRVSPTSSRVRETSVRLAMEFHRYIDVDSISEQRKWNKDNSLLYLFIDYLLESHNYSSTDVDRCIDWLQSQSSAGTEFQMTVKNKLEPVLKMLLEAGNNVNFSNRLEETVLRVFLSKYAQYSTNACKDREMIEALLRKGASVDVVDSIGYTPLQYATTIRRPDLLRLMLDHSDDLNARNSLGHTVLHLLVYSYEQQPSELHLEVMRELLSKGADVRATNKKGLTPVHLAIQNGLIQVLLTFAASGIQVADYIGDDSNLLLHLCKHIVHWTRSVDELEAFDRLVDLGKDVHSRSRVFYLTPLHFVSQVDRAEVVELLLTAGADINAISVDGVTPLHLAALRGSSTVVEYLMQCGADVHARDEMSGFGLMHMAVLSGDKGKLNLLIENRFDVNVKSKHGLTPLHLAVIMNDHKMLKCLIEQYINFRGSMRQMGMLRLNSIDMDCTDSKILIGADENVGELSLVSQYIKSMNVSATHLETLKMLLMEAGANVNAKDSSLKNLLHYAALQKDSKLDLLLSFGAHMDVKDIDGKSPLQNVLDSGNLRGLNELLRFGANLDQISVHNFNEWTGDIKNHLYDYLTQLEVVDLSISDVYKQRLLSHLRRTRMDRYQEKCEKEVTRLKSYYLTGSKISLHDFLHMSSRRRLTFAQTVLSLNLEVEFPIYRNIIEAYCRETMHRNMLMKQAGSVLCQLTGVNFPDICTDHICCYLDNRHLIIVIDSLDVVVNTI